MTQNDCPYGADKCPKVDELKEEMVAVKNKLNLIIAVLIALHGTEILGMLGVFGQ